jgi:predicted heme/steroid binding protein
MSERTTIGGVSYESVGSSSSNLLLKCNGTARIQWGSKLIDLIKNGKLNSENSSINITTISNESEIKSDGIYVLNSNEIPQLYVCVSGTVYNLSKADLYISTNKQDITVEQKQQVLENIGIIYNTLEELNNSGIQNGLVYVIENQGLYTVKDGVIKEFEAKVTTVTVENNDEQGEVINSSLKIVLSINSVDYLILENDRITINKPTYISNTVQIGSENADATKGYRLYMDKDLALLDIDDINVRTGSLLKHSVFSRGMIMMHSGVTPIPEGWAICDGNEYTYKGVTSITPNLINKFIKAVATPEEVMEVSNIDLNESNEFKLTSEHLPNHTHPHQAHTHSFSGSSSQDVSMSFYALNGATEKQAIVTMEGGTSGHSGDDTSGENITISDTVSINISGTTGEATSTEMEKTWENKPFKIEPNYYSLIFIMKL